MKCVLVPNIKLGFVRLAQAKFSLYIHSSFMVGKGPAVTILFAFPPVNFGVTAFFLPNQNALDGKNFLKCLRLLVRSFTAPNPRALQGHKRLKGCFSNWMVTARNKKQ